MPQCKAKSKQSGERCKRRACIGKEVCAIHGGKSTGAPKKNKNALKTGQYETISKDILLDEELTIYNELNISPVETLKEQIKLLRIKELRIAKRMKQALLNEQKVGTTDKDGKKYSSMVTLTATTTQNEHPDGSKSKSYTSNSETHEMHYLRLEQAHTSILDQIRKAMTSLTQMTGEQQSEKAGGVLITPGLLTETEWEKAAKNG